MLTVGRVFILEIAVKKVPEIIVILLASMLITSCSPGKIVGPTITPTPSDTPTHTVTFTPAITITNTTTPTNTPTNSPTNTPDCDVAAGRWESRETANFFGASMPIVVFTVNHCRISGWKIVVYPIPGELFMNDSSETVEIAERQFSESVTSDYGTYQVDGTFKSEKTCSGTLLFKKGFSVFGSIVTRDVSFSWTAILKE